MLMPAKEWNVVRTKPAVNHDQLKQYDEKDIFYSSDPFFPCFQCTGEQRELTGQRTYLQHV